MAYIHRNLQQVIVQVIAQLIQRRGHKKVIVGADLPEKYHGVLRHYVNIIFFDLAPADKWVVRQLHRKNLGSTNGTVSWVQLKHTTSWYQIEAIVHTAQNNLLLDIPAEIPGYVLHRYLGQVFGKHQLVQAFVVLSNPDFS
ncbi:MAG: hypothetical protein H6573_29995 [Lewinellaceae bacterium]|nr:hypothetical protein [Lewinellaceae bacterium]